jgi:hypothetical protein
MAGLGGGTPSRSCIRDKFKIGRLHQRPVGRLRIGTGDRLQMEIPAGLIAELSGWFLGLTTRPSARHVHLTALAQDSFDRGKAR